MNDPTTTEPATDQATMRAIVHRDYTEADGLRLEIVPRPEVTEGRLLVRVRAAALNPLDWHFMTGTPYFMRMMAGLRRPKRTIPGADIAGEVVAVGDGVTRFQPGDAVFGFGSGGFAEYARLVEDGAVAKPDHLSFAEVAALPIAGITALQALRDAGALQPGERVLINGASGGVGTYAIQIAKHLGAEVTGVCSTRNVELAQSLGADHVIDYRHEDFVAGPGGYDVMVDIAGSRSPRANRRVLAPGGRYVLVGGPKENRLLGPLGYLARTKVAFLRSGRSARSMLSQETQEDLQYLADLLAAGTIRSVIDRTYPLTEAADAFRHWQHEHATGKIIVSPEL